MNDQIENNIFELAEKILNKKQWEGPQYSNTFLIILRGYLQNGFIQGFFFSSFIYL